MMITIENLSKKFGTVTVLNHVSLDIPPGNITILAGADGAGKSTLFKILLGLQQKDEGLIKVKHQKIDREHKNITTICGYMPEKFSLYPDLTVEENMNFFADIQKVPLTRREDLKQKLLKRTGMIQFKGRRAGALSGGMKQKLALSTILLSAPELIILDEPTTGVDPLSRLEFFDIIKELKEEGKTILMSTPYLEEAEKGDYIVFLNRGVITKQDTIASLKKNFSAKIYTIVPTGNIYDLMEHLQKKEAFKENFYIKGQYLKFIQEKGARLVEQIPHREIREEAPTLEDIYLYYQKKMGAGQPHHA
jgi:ABC-2 type transport system ATP-binding protein